MREREDECILESYWSLTVLEDHVSKHESVLGRPFKEGVGVYAR